MELKAVETAGDKDRPTSANLELNVKNPLQLSPVIRCIYEFLRAKDIKDCRFVSKEWSSAAQSILRTRSKILFSKNEEGIGKNNIPEGFFNVFSETLANMPFTAFKVSGCENCPWTVTELSKLFEHEQSTIHELELEGIYLANENKEIFRNFNITPWLSKPVTLTFNAQLLTKLSVSCVGGYQDPTCLTVSGDCLLNIQDISLEYCEVIIREGISIAPVKLTLRSVRFCKNDDFLSEFRISEFFDFSKAREVELHCGDWEVDEDPFRSTIILDLNANGKVTLDKLTLSNIDTINWTTSEWTVNKLYLEAVKLFEKPGLQFRELDFNYDLIDLSSLPKSIENLFVRNIGNTTGIFCTSQVAIFENLRVLRLHFGDGDSTVISYFSECPKLVDIHLDNGYNSLKREQLKINFNWIPKSVKKLKLNNITVISEKAHQDLMLQKLIMLDCPYSEAKKVCMINVNVNELVLLCPRESNKHENFIDILEYESSHHCVKHIFAGPFYWTSKQSSGESRLAHYVDKISVCYQFQNQKGKAITQRDLEQLAEI